MQLIGCPSLEQEHFCFYNCLYWCSCCQRCDCESWITNHLPCPQGRPSRKMAPWLASPAKSPTHFWPQRNSCLGAGQRYSRNGTRTYQYPGWGIDSGWGRSTTDIHHNNDLYANHGGTTRTTRGDHQCGNWWWWIPTRFETNLDSSRYLSKWVYCTHSNNTFDRMSNVVVVF